MNEKELKRLSRKQLLELLLKQTEYADELQLQLEETKNELKNRILMENEAGSIADASLKLNGVFEAAQAAADQYLENIHHIHDNHVRQQKTIDDEYQKKANAMIADTKKRCEAYENLCRTRADKIIADAEERVKAMELEAKRVLAEVRRLHHYLMEKKLRIDKNK